MTTPRKTPAKRTTRKTPTTAARTPAKRTTKTASSKPPAKQPAKSTAPAARAKLATARGFVGSVEAALGALPLGTGDTAAAHLARAYAAALDRPRLVADRDEALDRVGPKLLAALAALGGTPAARHRMTGRPHTPPGGDTEDAPPTPPGSSTPGLDELRRVHGRG